MKYSAYMNYGSWAFESLVRIESIRHVPILIVWYLTVIAYDRYCVVQRLSIEVSQENSDKYGNSTKGRKKDWNPKEFSGEEMKKDVDKELITTKEKRKARDPKEFNRVELKNDAEKEMIDSEEMK